MALGQGCEARKVAELRGHPIGRVPCCLLWTLPSVHECAQTHTPAYTDVALTEPPRSHRGTEVQSRERISQRSGVEAQPSAPCGLEEGAPCMESAANAPPAHRQTEARRPQHPPQDNCGSGLHHAWRIFTYQQSRLGRTFPLPEARPESVRGSSPASPPAAATSCRLPSPCEQCGWR